MNRYARNIGTIGVDGQKSLNSKKVLVIGLGGLGGFVIEGLARMGIKTIGICDSDVFDETNLNRQILSTQSEIGNDKVKVAYERIKNIDSEINVLCYEKSFPNKDILKDICKYDLVIDCVDNMLSRVQLEKICINHNKKLIYGTVGGYYGSVAVISDKNMIINKMIETGVDESGNVEKEMGNPYSIVGVVSSLQVHLAILVLLNKPYLEKGMYYIDIQSFTIDEIVF